MRDATDLPIQASSMWGQMPAARARTARGRQLQDVRAAARTQCQDRRRRVLAHEWARERLCALFGYRDAAQWNGYVPPRSLPADDRGAQLARPNEEPLRLALVQLIKDVHHFEETGELPQEPADAEQLTIS